MRALRTVYTKIHRLAVGILQLALDEGGPRYGSLNLRCLSTGF